MRGFTVDDSSLTEECGKNYFKMCWFTFLILFSKVCAIAIFTLTNLKNVLKLSSRV